MGLCNHQHNVSLEYFHNSGKKPWAPRNCTPLFLPPAPLQQQISSLSLGICPFWTFLMTKSYSTWSLVISFSHSANILKLPLCGSVAVYSNSPSKAAMAKVSSAPQHVYSVITYSQAK